MKPVSSTADNTAATTGTDPDEVEPAAAQRGVLLEILERLEDDSDDANIGPSASNREPVLTVPVELTPLPEVDAALGTVALLGGVIRGKRARYRLAVLKTLQADRSWRWRIGRLQEIVH